MKVNYLVCKLAGTFVNPVLGQQMYFWGSKYVTRTLYKNAIEKESEKRAFCCPSLLLPQNTRSDILGQQILFPAPRVNI